jgi:integrase
VSGWADAETKTSRSRRTLELPPTAAAALRRQRAWQEEQRAATGDGWQDAAGTVFTDAIGRRVLGRAVADAFTRALRRLGLPAVRFHDLRHGAASLMLAEGVPLAVISRTLGHATISITGDVHSHLTRKLRRDAADAMDRALGGES